jgi:DNA polymerase I-like protein with 3'-5' exonuclease and polymerase domains
MALWQAARELPDLRRVGIVAIDTETNDEGLRAERGSAWPWHGGYICGISVAWRDESGIRGNYFPLRHPDSETFERENVSRWLTDLIKSGVRIVTQNGLYDWGWLRTDLGVLMPPSDQLEEIGAVATLIDENRFNYGLDALCAWRGLPGKDTALLQEAVKTAGWAPRRRTINVAEHIYKLPAHLVGTYAEADPIATLALFENLNPILDQEGTRDAYRLDVDLLPMVHEMRRRGIRIDQSAAEQARDYCLQKRDRALAELSEQLGTPVSMTEIASKKWLPRIFDAHHISYPHTKKGNPSFKADKTGWMVTHPHWLPRLIATASKFEKAGSTFLGAHILGHLINGRIYGEINPFRSENGGTCSFRFSYSNPPLQQMPSRDKELGPLIRRAFLPEEGEIWCKPDISQQEFRFVVHHAVIRDLPGAAAALERYLADPDTDFHALAGEITGIPRDDAKHVNFAKIYGAGVKKFAEMIGKPLSEAQALYAKYDQQLPFISRLDAACKNEADHRGYTVLYDGARRHWDRWAPKYLYVKGAGPCSHEEAKQRICDPGHPWFDSWLGRANIHTALNALIQGSAARHTKLWMRAVWREGVVPLLQMHDALELSTPSREQGELVGRLACEAVTLKVPMRTDVKFGRSWGDATHTWAERNEIAAPIAATQIAASQPQIGFSRVIEIPSETNKRTSEAPNGSESVHNPVPANTILDAHICAHCRQNPPDGGESPSTHGGLWLHAGCEETFIRARMTEEGIPWTESAPETPGLAAGSEAPAASPPQPLPPASPLNGGNGIGNGPIGGDTRLPDWLLNGGGNGRHSWADDDYSSGERRGGGIVATFVYHAVDGAPFMRVTKTTGGARNKQFPTDTWVDGRWESHRPPVGTLIPYRLPQLIAGRAGKTAFVCEGEKDCENVAALGLVATCNPFGASNSRDPAKSKWVPELNQHFAGYELVYVLEDNDDPGRKHAASVVRALSAIVPEIVVVRFAELPDTGDVSDWLATLNPATAKATLLARCERERKRQQGSAGKIKLVRLSAEPLEAVDWAWRNHILRDSVHVLTGHPGFGKGQVECSLMATVTAGRPWPDGTPGPAPGTAIIITGEDTKKDYRRRVTAAGGDCDRVLVLEGIEREMIGQIEAFVLRQDLAELERILLHCGDVRLIVIDPITAFMGGDKNFDSHRATDVRVQLTPLAKLAERSRVPVSLVTHPPKAANSQRASDYYGGSHVFYALPRCGHLCIDERIEGQPSGRFLFIPTKHSHGPATPGLAYTLEEVEIGWDADRSEAIRPSAVHWQGPIEMTSEEALAAAQPRREKVAAAAVPFLEAALLMAPIPKRVLEEGALKYGISEDQLRAAKKKLGIDAFRRGGSKGAWFWGWAHQRTAEETATEKGDD